MRHWQVLKERFNSSLTKDIDYDVYNCDKLIISGKYLGYEKGRYLFEKNNEVFKVNLHKMKQPEVIETIPLF